MMPLTELTYYLKVEGWFSKLGVKSDGVLPDSSLYRSAPRGGSLEMA